MKDQLRRRSQQNLHGLMADKPNNLLAEGRKGDSGAKQTIYEYLFYSCPRTPSNHKTTQKVAYAYWNTWWEF